MKSYLWICVPGVSRSKEILVLNVYEPLCSPDQLHIGSTYALLDHAALLYLGCLFVVLLRHLFVDNKFWWGLLCSAFKISLTVRLWVCPPWSGKDAESFVIDLFEKELWIENYNWKENRPDHLAIPISSFWTKVKVRLPGQKEFMESEMKKRISCTSKELKTLTSKTPAFSIWEQKSAIVISTLFCALLHWIILTSIQKSKYLSEKLMATSRATLPVKESSLWCYVQNFYTPTFASITDCFCMKYKINDFLLADSGYLATAVWVPEKLECFKPKQKVRS